MYSPMKLFLLIALVFVFSNLVSLGQNEEDNILPEFNIEKNYLNVDYFDASFFDQFMPFGGVNNNHLLMIDQFWEEVPTKFNWGQGVIHSDFYSRIYRYKGFNSWRVNYPLMFGLNYKSDGIFGLQKLHLLLDANGMMINNNNGLVTEGTLGLTNERSFVWETGAGIGYEFSPNTTIFIKVSQQFIGIQPLGRRYTSGLNMNF